MFKQVYTLPILVGIVGAAASIFAFTSIGDTKRLTEENDLLTQSKIQVQEIRDRIIHNLDVLSFAKSYFSVAESIDRQAFNAFAAQLTSNRSDIQALEWIPRVTEIERELFETQARLDGVLDFSIKEFDANGELVNAQSREQYFPALYVEPAEGRSAELGYDFASDTDRLATLSSAAATGLLTSTPPIPLSLDDESQVGVMVFIPVFNNTESRRFVVKGTFDQIKGFALLVLRADDMIKSTLGSDSNVQSIVVQDVTNSDISQTIYSTKINSKYGSNLITSRVTYNESIAVAGRLWRIDIEMVDPPAGMGWTAWLVLFGGFILTTLTSTWLVKRREEIDALTLQVNTLDLIVQNSDDIFMTTEFTGPDQQINSLVIKQANEAITRLTGYTLDEAAGGPLSMLFGEKTDSQQLNNFCDAKRDAKPYVGELELYTKDQQCFWAKVNHIPILNGGGEQIHSAVVVRDISERKKAEIDRERLIGELSDSNEELERFAFVCSHDLQEPLRMIRCFSEKLETHLTVGNESDEKSKKYLGFITDGAERAQNLVVDILSYSSLSSSTEILDSFSTEEVVNNIADNMALTLEENGAQITLDTLPELQGNKTQLYQVFQNLINNAIKYQTSDATPHVHIGVSDAGEHWLFSVKDNGIGIEQRHIHKVFDVFQRLHRKEQYAGTGIGLAICKKVVERHGGTLWVESEHGIGSTFFFTLLKQNSSEGYYEQQRKAS